MNAAAAYGPHHHGYPDAHHMPPPQPSHHYPSAYPPQHHHYPHSMMPPPPQSSYAQSHYAPHHPPHHYPAYGPHVASPQPMAPPPGYTSYPQPPSSQHMTLPAISAPPTSAPPGSVGHDYAQRMPDATGQIAPPGTGKPKVAATLWEDEGTLCFQVESNGICVTRRHDNHMINGTKLLNVAKMTRGRRDGLLKSEKQRRVMKIGPMHLKGVWIPYDRALDFANKEKITEQLYPLFLHNIDGLLSQQGGNGQMPVPGQAVCGKNPPSKEESNARDSESPPQRPSLPQQHLIADATESHTRQSAQPRPGLERAHTLPQPPSGTSSSLGLGNSGSSFEFGSVTVPSSHAPFDSKSLPTTPSATSPNHSISSMQPQYASMPGYDTRHSVSGPPMQNPYGPPTGYYGQKGDMGPPPRSSRDLEGGSHGSYEHGYYTNQQAVDPSASPYPRSSPQTGSATWPSYHHPQRSHTLPHSQVVYPTKTPGAANGYTASSPSSQGYAYPSAAGSAGKRVRDEDDETVNVELDGSLKRQKTADEAAAKYRTKSSSARR